MAEGTSTPEQDAALEAGQPPVILYPATACEIDVQYSAGFEDSEWFSRQLRETTTATDGDDTKNADDSDDPSDDDDDYYNAKGTWQGAVERRDWAFFGVDINSVLRCTHLPGGSRSDMRFGLWKRETDGMMGLDEMLARMPGKPPLSTPKKQIPSIVVKQISSNRKLPFVKTSLTSNLKLDVSLCGLSSPVVTRHIRVPGGLPLAALHDKVLCPAFGWTRGFSHYQFIVPPERYAGGQLPRDPGCDVCFAPTGPGTMMDMFGREDGFRQAARCNAQKINDSDVAVGDLVHHIGDTFQYIFDKLRGWKLDITLAAVEPEGQPTDILGGTGAPPPEQIEFELYWECYGDSEGPMIAGVEAYAIFIHLFNDAQTKEEKDKVLDELRGSCSFRQMTGFHRSGLTSDFQPEIFSDIDLQQARSELQQALRHRQTIALEHQDPSAGLEIFGAEFSGIFGGGGAMKQGVCGSCRKHAKQVGHDLLKCGRCKNQWYCSEVCQKDHWAIHKKVCVRLTVRTDKGEGRGSGGGGKKEKNRGKKKKGGRRR